MRAVVLGAQGQLGRALTRAFRGAGEVLALDRAEADIADEAELYPRIRDFAPDIILNAAAYTDVDGAEDNLEQAFLVNEAGARNVADVAAYQGVPVVYYSTDYVFGGEGDAPLQPKERIAPNGVYAKSKAAGETATRKANAQHFIIRTAWLYGPGGNNFVEKILRAAATRPELKVVEDEIGSPTYTLDLAEATYYLVRTKQFGTYHIVNRGQCTRYEQARTIIDLAELPVKVRPCARDEFPAKAPRPRYSVLDPGEMEEVTGHRMRGWKEALVDYMQKREAVV